MSQEATLDAWSALVEADPAAASNVLAQLKRSLFVPHLGQVPILESDARFRILRAGRRWGKTKMAAHEVIMAAIKDNDQMVWWVANTDKNVRRGYREVLKQIPRELLAKDPPSDKANDRILEFKNGSRIEFYTAGTPDALAGEGVDFVVLDEAALIAENVWFQLVRPTLSDTKGRALIISTPRGRNWFHKLWHRGQRGDNLYQSWRFTSYDNPFIDNEEIDDARDTLPSIIFQQEYLAEFVANAASMFTWAEQQVLEALEVPLGHLVAGIDLAKKEDFTVIDIARAEDRKPVFYHRTQKESWPDQERMIVETIHDLEQTPGVDGVTVVVDSTGVGDVVYDHLEEAGLDVVPINFSQGVGGRQKERMVRLLAADLEHGRAWLHEQQTDEFESYEYNITDAGRYQFEAASGHDDKVSAKLLQNWGIVHEAPGDVKVMDFEGAEYEEDDLEDETEPELIRPDSVADIMNRPEAWV